MKEATEFLKNLKVAQWHNLNDIPTDLKDSVWDIIDGNSLDGYRFYIHEEYDYLYTIATEDRGTGYALVEGMTRAAQTMVS